MFLSSSKYKYSNNLLETMIKSLEKKGLNSIQVYKESSDMIANLMLIPKDLLIINTPNLLNYILSDNFKNLDLDNFNGDYFINEISKMDCNNSH